MRRQLVRSRGIVVTVDLRQDHVRRVGLILNDVERQYAGLGQRGPGIDQGSGQEILDSFRPDPRMNMNDQHVLTMPYGSAMSLPRQQRRTQARPYFGDTRIRVEAENLHNGEVLKADSDWKPTW